MEDDLTTKVLAAFDAWLAEKPKDFADLRRAFVAGWLANDGIKVDPAGVGALGRSGATDHFRFKGEFNYRGKLVEQRAIVNDGHSGSILNCPHPACARLRVLAPPEEQDSLGHSESILNCPHPACARLRVLAPPEEQDRPKGEAIRAGEAQPLNLDVIRRQHALGYGQCHVDELIAEVEQLRGLISAACEACPSIRMQDHADASLLELIHLEVGRGFNRDAEVHRLAAKVERLRAASDAPERDTRQSDRVIRASAATEIWQPIETAPKRVPILGGYADFCEVVEQLTDAEKSSREFHSGWVEANMYEGNEAAEVIIPLKWMPLPALSSPSPAPPPDKERP